MALAYPGNAYVNDIGVDAFDETSVTSQTSADAWSESLFPALTSAQQFAQEQNEPLAIPEWGVLSSGDRHGLGDDPSYVNEMITWMQNPANGVAYESYFDDDTSSITGGNFPNSLTATSCTTLEHRRAPPRPPPRPSAPFRQHGSPSRGVRRHQQSGRGRELCGRDRVSPHHGGDISAVGASTGSSYGWSYLTTQSALASWLSSWVGTSDQMVIGIPMVALDGSGNPENTLADGAAGDENANFVAIAKNLVALGFGNAVLRLGWEFDGTWYPWKVQSDSDVANFATYWQNVVTAMRSVPGGELHVSVESRRVSESLVGYRRCLPGRRLRRRRVAGCVRLVVGQRHLPVG